MMKRSLANQLKGRIGQDVKIEGWLHNFRAMGKLGFLIVRDRSGLAQVVVENRDMVKTLSSLQVGSVLSVVGTAQ